MSLKIQNEYQFEIAVTIQRIKIEKKLSSCGNLKSRNYENLAHEIQ